MMRVPQSRGEFDLLVVEIKAANRTSLVKATYQILDELSVTPGAERLRTFACAPGCSFCCHQLVCCTKMEWRVIYEFLLGRGMLRGQTGERLRQHTDEWKQLWKQRPELFVSDLTRIIKEWLGKLCPFLNSKWACDIYPVRPIDCRTMYSTKACQDWHWLEVKRFPFPWEMWANNLILEEDERSNGRNQMGVTPLPHWLCTIQF